MTRTACSIVSELAVDPETRAQSLLLLRLTFDMIKACEEAVIASALLFLWRVSGCPGCKRRRFLLPPVPGAVPSSRGGVRAAKGRRRDGAARTGYRRLRPYPPSALRQVPGAAAGLITILPFLLDQDCSLDSMDMADKPAGYSATASDSRKQVRPCPAPEDESIHLPGRAWPR